MNYELKNKYLTAVITTLGAELISLRDTENVEYIWNADEKYWKRHTPVLFPAVGKIVEGKYTAAGKEYALPAHGFARDLMFEVESYSKESIVLVLKSFEASKQMYPYDFCLKIIYTLKDKRLEIAYEVTNRDIKDIFFKIGAHPGFMCPFFEGEKLKDYYLAFEKEEEITEIPVTPEIYLSNEIRKVISKKIPLTKELFKDGPLIFTDFTSTSMTLASLNHDRKLTVAFEGFPFLGIWSTVDEAPFVCIEPWHGHADFIDDSREISEKRDIISLQPQEVFSCLHSIIIS